MLQTAILHNDTYYYGPVRESCADRQHYIMVQKEVADRMQAGPGKKDYGALSLAVQYYSHPEIVVNVPPSCFMPQPKVGSSVISLKRYEKPVVDVDDEKLMFKSHQGIFQPAQENSCQRAQQFRWYGTDQGADTAEYRGSRSSCKCAW